MKTIEVEVVSKKIIKPSSPTPQHLHHYQLSFLDQIAPPVYNPCVMFYSNQADLDEISHKLKKSLSDVLTKFYPLAGRLKENLFIDCNDEGIPFLVAKVKCQLYDVIQNPAPNELNKFIPFESDKVTDLVLGIQLNIFECGGIAIGSCISHKVADGLSSFMFLKSWAATARGDLQMVHPQFVSATLFPPKNISGFNPRVGMTNEKNIVSKRFVFSAAMMEALREKYGHAKSLEKKTRPTRVEALSAFLWSRFVAASQVDTDGAEAKQAFYAIVHAVNLRTRIDPPLSDDSFGNLFRMAITIPSSGEEGCDLVKKMSDQISHINIEYVRKLQEEGMEHLNFIKDRSEMFFKGEMISFNLTSWCRFPVYESDFGWGKPAWVGSPPFNIKNLVVLVDTKSGHGIEAFINLEEQVMAKFECDKESLAFLSPNGLKY
ncbi:hypothetical protein UlMin_040071 [Ulmus minor]